MFTIFIVSITALVVVAMVMEHKEEKTMEINKNKKG